MRKFKLAYIPFEQTPNLERRLAAMAEAGWEGWEIRQPLDWLGSAKRVRELSERAGLVPAIVNARAVTRDAGYTMMEENKRRLEFAAELGVDCFMFMGFVGRGPAPITATEREDDIKALAEVGERFAEYGEELGGLEVCYHIHTQTTVDSKEEWQMFMGLIDKCKLCIDVSHSALWGWDPSDSLRAYRDQLIYVHFQDWATYRYLCLGEGDGLIDFPQVLKTLEEIGFDRWVGTIPGVSRLSEEEKIRVNREYLRKLGY